MPYNERIVSLRLVKRFTGGHSFIAECSNHTYNHVVADVAERGLLKDVLHEAVSRRVYLQGVAWLGTRRGRGCAGNGRRDRRDGEARGVRRGHPDVAEMACAAAHIGEELRLVLAAVSEEVVGALAANALSLEGQGALESLQLQSGRRRDEVQWGAKERETVLCNDLNKFIISSLLNVSESNGPQKSWLLGPTYYHSTGNIQHFLPGK